jgi:hypothetical protein
MCYSPNTQPLLPGMNSFSGYFFRFRRVGGWEGPRLAAIGTHLYLAISAAAPDRVFAPQSFLFVSQVTVVLC